MRLVKNKRENTVSTHLLPMRDMNHITTLNSITTPIHTTTVVITILTPILITAVVLEAEDSGMAVVLGAEDSEVAVGAEGIEDLDRIRDPLKEEFESRVPMKQGSTAGSKMTLPFLENLL